MTPNETLQAYIALKLHFTSSYDYFLYNGKLKKQIDYSKRKDKFQIQKIARHEDPLGLMVSNLVINPNVWLGEIITNNGYKNYQEWLKRKESLSYTFREDLNKLVGSFTEVFRVDGHQHPPALNAYLGEKICLETLVLVNALTKFYQHWDTELKDDLYWKRFRLVIPKYQPFVKFDRPKIKAVLKERFMDSNT